MLDEKITDVLQNKEIPEGWNKELLNIYDDAIGKEEFLLKTIEECRHPEDENFISAKILETINRLYHDSKYISLFDIFGVFVLFYLNNGYDKTECKYRGIMSNGSIDKYVNFGLNGLPAPTISLLSEDKYIENVSTKGFSSISFFFNSKEERDDIVSLLVDHIESYVSIFKQKGIFTTLEIFVTEAYVYRDRPHHPESLNIQLIPKNDDYYVFKI